ncbi:uncharacterized protein [Argopecten irradians]
MRLFVVLVLCLLTNSAEGFLGIGRFFSAGKKSMKRVANVVEEESRAYRRILEQDVVPEVISTLRNVTDSATEIVKIADKLEQRIEASLEKLDDLIVKTGYRIDNLSDLIIIFCTCFLFVVIGLLCDKMQVTLYYFAFQFMRVVCVVTVMMLMVRLICELVLRVHLSTAATIKYGLIAPTLSVLVWAGFYLVYQTRFVLGYCLWGPRLILYCTIDGPCRWTYGAYKYGPESNSKKGFLLSIFLPWLTPLVCFAVFHLLAGNVGDDDESEVAAMKAGFLLSYIFFVTCANHLRMFYLRPEPQQHLRNIHTQNGAVMKGTS